MFRQDLGQTLRDVNDGGLSNYYNQLTERRDWLFSLGIIENLAHDLAMQTMQLPEFNLGHFQQRVRRLSMQTGPSRLAAVDNVVLNEIQEMMQRTRTPSPAQPFATNLNWVRGNEPDTTHISSTVFEEPDGKYQLRYLRRMPDVVERDDREERPSFYRNNMVNNSPNEKNSKNHENVNHIKKQLPRKGNNLNPHINRNTGNNRNRNRRQRSRFNRNKMDQARKQKANSLKIINKIRLPINFKQRKRAAHQLPETNLNEEPKKRKLENPKQIFNIGAFEMPYIRMNMKPLPQPEHKSYAIKFFQRKHSYIVGGGEEVASLTPQAKLSFPPNYRFSDGLRFRRRLRDEFLSIYFKMDYEDWSNWWKDFEWCKLAIDKELELFKGTNLKLNSFLPPGSTLDLLLIPQLFAPKSTSFPFLIASLLELTKESYLENLDMDGVGKLEDVIRHISNDLWANKMRGMVYLWSRYYKIQILGNTMNSAEVFATQTQWNCPVFHWLAKKAYEELMNISETEWPEHNKMFHASKTEEQAIKQT